MSSRPQYHSDLSCYSLKLNNNVPTSRLDFKLPEIINFHDIGATNGVADNSTVNASVGAATSSTPNRTTYSTTSTTHSAAASSTVYGATTGHPNGVKKPSKLDVLIQTATSVELELLLPSNQIKIEKRSFQDEATGDTGDGNGSGNDSGFKKCKISSDDDDDEKLKIISHNPKKISKGKKQSINNLLSIKLASPSTSSKRQRSGPSCDCCRSRKIKCDSEILILSELTNPLPNFRPEKLNSSIANCEFISMNKTSGYQFYKIIKDNNENNSTKLNTYNFLQFKPCSACFTKKLKCSFSKGFTRNDIIKFNKSEKLNTKTTNTNSFQNSNNLSSVNPQSASASTSNSSTSSSSTSNSNLHSNYSSSSSPIDSTPTSPYSSVPMNDPSSFLLQNNSLPTPSPTPSLAALPLASSVMTKDSDEKCVNKKQSKKTSCKSCRFKKIKCIKIDGNSICFNCNKKNVSCVFE